MKVTISKTKAELGRQAASEGASAIRGALAARGEANIILATGASQFETLGALVKETAVDWSRVTCFHLDEYEGMSADHPASFRRYLRERFVERLPIPPRAFHFIQAERDLPGECRRLGELIRPKTIDAAFIGIGENGHLAFNDPPADLATDEAYIVVELDEACRKQQVGEGWFASLSDTPRRAISMSIRQIMRSQNIFCSVPDERKAAAVQAALEGPVTPLCPASILQQHGGATIYLDAPAASRLARAT